METTNTGYRDLVASTTDQAQQQSSESAVSAAPPPQIKTVCCHTMSGPNELAGTGIQLLVKPCHRLFENCSVDGCCDNTSKQRVCDCQANLTFYVLLGFAVFGVCMGLAYAPPNDDTEGAGSNRRRFIGYGGHGCWVFFFMYCLFRTVSHSASAQLDSRTCRARS